MRLDFLHAGRPGTVRVEVAANDDPAALGCSDDARGLPYCRAVIEQDARGYGDALGWIQLVHSSDTPRSFAVDPFEPLGEVTHPFCFFGFAPTLFDGPSRRAREDMTWRAHTFLGGIRNDREAFSILGFAWGFTIRDGEVSIVGPTELDRSAWDDRVPSLEESCPRWRFLPGSVRG
ncbi:MAG: hypothetical protein JWO14_20 [Solirubrobacterales bacterium]|nr:hypothetical protein [Solirubrobacterales bacterium]